MLELRECRLRVVLGSYQTEDVGEEIELVVVEGVSQLHYVCWLSHVHEEEEVNVDTVVHYVEEGEETPRDGEREERDEDSVGLRGGYLIGYVYSITLVFVEEGKRRKVGDGIDARGERVIIDEG